MTAKRVRALTAKQKAFCHEYLIDLNATQAAIRAGYSKNRASEIGYQQLQKTTMQTEIQRLMTKRSKKTEITAEYVLAEIKKVAESCAEQVKTESGEQVRNPIAALKGFELLGRHLVMFSDKVVHDVDVKLTGFNVSGK